MQKNKKKSLKTHCPAEMYEMQISYKKHMK